MDCPQTQPGKPSPSPSGDALMYSPELGKEDAPAIPFSPCNPWALPHASSQSSSFYPPPASGQYSFASPSTIYAPSTNYLPWNNAVPYSIYSPALPSMPGPSEPSLYAAGNASGYMAVTAVNQHPPSHEGERKIRSTFPYTPVPVPTSGHANPASSYPEHVLYWEYVSQNAVVIDGPRIFVPQTIYQPQSQGDKERYVSSAKLQPPIIFSKQNSPEWGISLQHLLSREPAQLLGGNEPAFTACGPTFGIRVLWPGYPSWHKQVSTKDYTSKRNVISKEKLARLVARAVKQHMDAMSVQAGSDPRWIIGPHNIGVDDVILISLHHVSQGSWQPHLRLRFVSSHDHQAIAGPSTGIYR